MWFTRTHRGLLPTDFIFFAQAILCRDRVGHSRMLCRSQNTILARRFDALRHHQLANWPTDDDAERRNVLPKSYFVIYKASSSVLLCLNHNHEGDIEKVVWISQYYVAGAYDIQWIPFVLRKTLFDFIKSCGCQIRLKFSAVALLGLLYSPK